MSNEQNVQEENTQAAPEPVDIAQAFRMYNQSQQESAEPPVQSGEPGEEADNGEPGSDGSGDVADDLGQDQSLTASADTGTVGSGDNSGGGSGNVIEPVDYSPAKQDILKRIQEEAINQVRKEMNDQGIGMWTMNDIYERDEATGRATFKNPDDPNHPFANRTEAQAWINSINEDINNHFRAEVNKKQRELVQQNAPTLQMIDFATTYQSMSKQEQEIFNELIEPYAIQDRSGKVIGFNANLSSVANVAKKLASKFSQPAPQQTQQKAAPATPPSTPAMDIPTGNGGAAGIDGSEEPKTIGEALKMVDKMNRKQKEGK